MEVMDQWDVQGEGRLVNGRGEARESVLDHPKVIFSPGLQRPKFPFHPEVMPSLEGHGEPSREARAPKGIRRAEIIFHLMLRRKSRGKKLGEALLTTGLEIAAENLEDPQFTHLSILEGFLGEAQHVCYALNTGLGSNGCGSRRSETGP